MNRKQQSQKPDSSMNPGLFETDPKKVKREIRRDINNGQGAMTSREAGAMRD